MAVNDVNDSTLNSSVHASLDKSITSMPKNKILLDNVSNWYLFEGQIIMPMYIMKKYENILKADLYDYEVPDEYLLKPEYVCNALYGTTDLWYLLLFVNDMKDSDDFTKKNIKIFRTSIVETINDIVNNERDAISPKHEPRYIKKHYLKDLNEPSIDVLGEKYYKEIPIKDIIDFTDELGFLCKNYAGRYLRVLHKKIMSNSDIVEPFELSRGVFNIPSCKYKEGYTDNYKGKVYLEEGKYYSILQLYSGNVNLRLFSDDGNDVLLNLGSPDNIMMNKGIDFDFGEYFVIDDLRSTFYDFFINSMNLMYNKSSESSTTVNIYSGSISCFSVDNFFVSFEEENGKYYLRSKIKISRIPDNFNAFPIYHDELNRFIFPVAKFILRQDTPLLLYPQNKKDYYYDVNQNEYKFIDEREDIEGEEPFERIDEELTNFDRLDIQRLQKYDYLYLECEYSANFDPEYFIFSGYSVTVNYTDGTSNKNKSYTEDSEIYNTNGEISKLKIAVKNERNKKIDNIKIDFNITPIKWNNDGYTSEFESKVFNVKIKGYKYKDILTTPFTVNESNWYNFIMTYDYTKEFNGIYFQPKLLTLDSDDTDISSENVNNNFMYQSKWYREVDDTYESKLLGTKPKTIYNPTHPTRTQLEQGLNTGQSYTRNINDHETTGNASVDNHLYVLDNDNNNIWHEKFSTDLVLPDEYILTFFMGDTSYLNVTENGTTVEKNSGGAVFFVFESNKNFTEGYMLVNTNASEIYSDRIPEMNTIIGEDGNEYTIMQTGFYKLHPKGQRYYILKDNKTLYFNAFLIQPLSDKDFIYNRICGYTIDENGNRVYNNIRSARRIKIVKRYNLIYIYAAKYAIINDGNNTPKSEDAKAFDYDNPIVMKNRKIEDEIIVGPYKDNDGYYSNGGFRLGSIFKSYHYNEWYEFYTYKKKRK